MNPEEPEVFIKHQNLIWILVVFSFRYRRSTHVTPKSYLSFINGYKTIYADKKGEIGEMAHRMNTGIIPMKQF